MAKYLRDLYSSPSDMVWCRPTHRTQNRRMVTSCFACCYCLAANCCWVFEMWGQGGGGAGACCCQWGLAGGQGGDYGWRTFPCGCATAQTLCLCGCSCCCLSLTCLGHPGQFTRLTNCTSGSIYCVAGGTGGITNCFWMQATGCSYNQEFNTCRLECSYGAPQFASCCEGRLRSSYQSDSTNQCANCKYFFSPNQCSGLNRCLNLVDSIFCYVNCTCFCFYRRGSCGFSGYQGGCCQCYGATLAGVGGAAYAGGGPQWDVCNVWWAYCGKDGNFPGGGGHSAGSCGGPCCLGSLGGRGAILLSWGT